MKICSSSLLVLCTLLCLVCATASTSADEDRIAGLYGQPTTDVDFQQYGGYISLDDSAGTNLYYYFVEASTQNASSMPLLLWLNGGPGCSSLVGAMQEIGPFRVNTDSKTLIQNPYSWNKVANLLFLESPAGVGFSYANDTSESHKGGDTKTANNSYNFLLKWFKRFPQYKGRDFYMGGESYAGHYVLQLAHVIQHFNKVPNNSNFINFKGIILGNPVLDLETENRGFFEYLWGHGAISDESFEKIKKKCNFQQSGLVDGFTDNPDCNSSLHAVGRLTGEFFDVHYMYGYTCIRDTMTRLPTDASLLIEHLDKCATEHQNEYLSIPEAQQAMHAKPLNQWFICNGDMHDTWKERAKTVLPLLKELLSDKIRVWVYSGDNDGRIPFISTKYAINKLKLQVKTPWSPWLVDVDVAGFMVEYDGLTFLTVRGAGHAVPSYRPKESLDIIERFVQGSKPHILQL